MLFLRNLIAPPITTFFQLTTAVAAVPPPATLWPTASTGSSTSPATAGKASKEMECTRAKARRRDAGYVFKECPLKQGQFR